MTDHYPYAPPTDEQLRLGGQYEDACDAASRLYDAGEDTTEADAEVDRLLAQLREKGWA